MKAFYLQSPYDNLPQGPHQWEVVDLPLNCHFSKHMVCVQ